MVVCNPTRLSIVVALSLISVAAVGIVVALSLVSVSSAVGHHCWTSVDTFVLRVVKLACEQSFGCSPRGALT